MSAEFLGPEFVACVCCKSTKIIIVLLANDELVGSEV